MIGKALKPAALVAVAAAVVFIIALLARPLPDHGPDHHWINGPSQSRITFHSSKG